MEWEGGGGERLADTNGPIPTRKRPVYYSVYCVYSNLKPLLARISEYFTLRRG